MDHFGKKLQVEMSDNSDGDFWKDREKNKLEEK